ncbi:50S ribosomal protein L29 [Spiroplasma taiwanense CT-1]|uniref:Large ribosomal subunit protein uL29 n=1 Tax=Spiroplasma taiwanense CT-1 TaxID=1276220 RepID=S5LYE8_9MOLU|nr:50S ribosomal protein L29 [Spiroplasma taiwanense]AGR41606.1 50S ribosomal protein L29 [Spiroplasma taiwanense CT-1]
MSKAVDFMLELRTKTIEDLIKLGEDRRAELFALKFQAAVGSLEQTHRIKTLKKDVARIEFLLSERKNAGEIINKNIKANYSKAVEEAEKAGKQVRKKHKEMIEKLQSEQFGSDNAISEDAIMAAMQQATENENLEAVEVKSAPKKESVAKSAAKKEVEVKSAPKKESVAKVKEIELPNLQKGEAKSTGKGKAALESIKPKTVKVGTVKGEGIEGIELKLSKKPKNAKTYTFGSNAQEAKKQIEEANKKAAAKKTTTKGAK